MLNRYTPEEIVPALTHYNGRVRRYAAMILGIDGDDQLVTFLVTRLQSESRLRGGPPHVPWGYPSGHSPTQAGLWGQVLPPWTGWLWKA